MKNIQRGDIHIISRHSNITEKGVDGALKENVYNNQSAWKKFLRLFFITLAVGFTVSGIVFFFAYNWEYLHKFVKLGLAEGLIVIATGLVLFPKINITIRNNILTGASVLVGVLFAVFGQIYQTGANAYDFFLGWTIFVTLWVVVSNFAPLRLLYLVLINTTLILYSDQVATDWSNVFIFTLLFGINTIGLLASIILSSYKEVIRVPDWFMNAIALSSCVYATIGIIFGIFGTRDSFFYILFLLTLIVFALGIWYGLKVKSGFYLSVIPFSTIIIVSALLIKISDDEAMFLIVGLFIIISVTLVVRNLIAIQKKWTNEE